MTTLFPFRSRRTTRRGYVEVYVPGHPRARRGNNQVLEHILVAESVLKKPLPAKAVVHHVDGNGTNNQKNNLVICENQGYHKLLHYREKIILRGGRPNHEKVCCTCNVLKPVSDFHRKSSNPDGFSKRCKSCRRAKGHGVMSCA